jgi:hypothetical protein
MELLFIHIPSFINSSVFKKWEQMMMRLSVRSFTQINFQSNKVGGGGRKENTAKVNYSQVILLSNVYEF